MRFLFYILVLVLTYTALAVDQDLYVNSGSNDNCDGTSSDVGTSGNCAEKTIQAAINDVSAVAPDKATIHVAAGSYTEGAVLTFDSGENAELIVVQGASAATTTITSSGTSTVNVPGGGGPTTGTYTFKNITVAGGASCTTGVIRIVPAAVNLVLDGAIVTNASTGPGITLYTQSTPARNVTMTGGSITTGGHCISMDAAGGLGTLSCTSCALTNTTNGNACIALDGTPQAVLLDDVTFTTTATGSCVLSQSAGTTLLDAYLPILEFHDCKSGSGGIGYLGAVPSRINRVILDNCDFTSITPGASGSRVVNIGTEVVADDDLETSPYPIDSVMIVNTRLVSTGADANHIIYTGPGATRVRILNSEFICSGAVGSEYGAVFKSPDLTIIGSYFYGPSSTVFLSGASDSFLSHNTIYARTGVALNIDTNQETEATGGSTYAAGTYGQSARCILVDNIIVSQDGVPCYVDLGGDATNAPTWGLLMDYNLYWTLDASSPVVANIGGTTVTQVTGNNAALTARWAAYSTLGGYSRRNDTHSVVAEPVFLSIGVDSEVFLGVAGGVVWSAASDGRSNIGAWQPKNSTSYVRTRRVGG